MDHIISRLTPKDIPHFRALMRMFADNFDDQASYQQKQPSDDYVRDLLGKDDVVVLAALLGDEVVGGLVAYELQKFEQERSELYIYDLAVAEKHRRKGVATALIETVKVIAKETGAWVIYVQADPPDEPAVKLYTKLGIREDVLHFDIKPAA